MYRGWSEQSVVVLAPDDAAATVNPHRLTTRLPTLRKCVAVVEAAPKHHVGFLPLLTRQIAWRRFFICSPFPAFPLLGCFLRISKPLMATRRQQNGEHGEQVLRRGSDTQQAGRRVSTDAECCPLLCHAGVFATCVLVRCPWIHAFDWAWSRESAFYSNGLVCSGDLKRFLMLGISPEVSLSVNSCSFGRILLGCIPTERTTVAWTKRARTLLPVRWQHAEPPQTFIAAPSVPDAPLAGSSSFHLRFSCLGHCQFRWQISARMRTLLQNSPGRSSTSSSGSGKGKGARRRRTVCVCRPVHTFTKCSLVSRRQGSPFNASRSQSVTSKGCDGEKKS